MFKKKEKHPGLHKVLGVGDPFLPYRILLDEMHRLELVREVKPGSNDIWMMFNGDEQIPYSIFEASKVLEKFRNDYKLEEK